MEKKKTPVSTVVFYIIGIILLIVSLFMLWTAVNYTKSYIQTYDASFKDMWSNSLQYIIAQFVPYFGMGVICIGLGRAISGFAAKAAGAAAEETEPAIKAEEKAEPEEAAEPAEAAQKAEPAVDTDGLIEELARRIDTNREVLSIKIEEKEKRDSFRIKELERKVEGFLSDVKYINEPLEELVYKQAAGIEDEVKVEPAVEAGPVPQIFRMARAMTMPACPAAGAGESEEAAAAAAGAVPQVFRVARNMTMPACPAAEEAAEAVGAVPPVFRVARTMTMTV